MKKEAKVSTETKRVRALYSGLVQGVGFRYTAIHIARSYNVTGYVKNLDDGRVEVVAEGDERELGNFFSSIDSSQLKNYIHKSEIEYSWPTGRYKEFTIEY